MFTQWIGKNVDLDILFQQTIQFFKKKTLGVVSDRTGGSYTIIVMPKRALGLREEISVTITGEPNDFEVQFVSGDKSRTLKNLGQLTSLFGGGFFLLEGLRSLEAIEKLEREFWVFMEEAVAQLAGVANTKK